MSQLPLSTFSLSTVVPVIIVGISLAGHEYYTSNELYVVHSLCLFIHNLLLKLYSIPLLLTLAVGRTNGPSGLGLSSRLLSSISSTGSCSS